MAGEVYGRSETLIKAEEPSVGESLEDYWSSRPRRERLGATVMKGYVFLSA